LGLRFELGWFLQLPFPHLVNKCTTMGLGAGSEDGGLETLRADVTFVSFFGVLEKRGFTPVVTSWFFYLFFSAFFPFFLCSFYIRVSGLIIIF